jgi:hypothetical protein
MGAGDAFPTGFGRGASGCVIKGANVWVHELLLTWKPSQPPIAYWVTKDAPCPPWSDGSLPSHLNSGGRAIPLDGRDRALIGCSRSRRRSR